MLKRKLLWLIGAAPPPEDMDKAEGALSQEIQEEIKELVAQIDTDGDGLLDDYEIAQKMEGDPLLQGRLQVLLSFSLTFPSPSAPPPPAPHPLMH